MSNLFIVMWADNCGQCYRSAFEVLVSISILGTYKVPSFVPCPKVIPNAAVCFHPLPILAHLTSHSCQNNTPILQMKKQRRHECTDHTVRDASLSS